MQRYTLVAFGFLAACASAQVTPEPGPGLADPQNPSSPSASSELAPPVLLPTVGSTANPSVAVRGTAPPNTAVLIKTTARGVLPTITTGSDGSFCADVPLAANDLNLIDVRAQDAAGNLSKSATAMVMQTGYALPADPPSVPHNAAAMATIAFNENQFDLQNGAITDMVDDNQDSYTELDFDNINLGGGTKWIWLTFNRAQEAVQRISIKSPASCPLLNYRAYVSKATLPMQNFQDGAEWSELVLTGGANADFQIDEETFAQPKRMTHIALELSGPGCEVGFFGWDTWRISEITAMTVQDNTPAPADTSYLCRAGK